MREQTVCFPHSVNEYMIDLEHACQAARRPVCRVPRFLLRRHLDDSLLQIAAVLARATRTRSVLLDSRQSELRVAGTPQPDRGLRSVHLCRDLSVLQTLGG